MPNTVAAIWIGSWFRAAAIYGVVVLTASLADLSTDDAVRATQVAFVGIAGAFQWMFWVIASDPLRYRAFIPVAVAEKLAFGIPALMFANTAPDQSTVVVLAVADCMLGASFLKAWLALRRDDAADIK